MKKNENMLPWKNADDHSNPKRVALPGPERRKK
jgi:hypothetical protein